MSPATVMDTTTESMGLNRTAKVLVNTLAVALTQAITIQDCLTMRHLILRFLITRCRTATANSTVQEDMVDMHQKQR